MQVSTLWVPQIHTVDLGDGEYNGCMPAGWPVGIVDPHANRVRFVRQQSQSTGGGDSRSLLAEAVAANRRRQ